MGRRTRVWHMVQASKAEALLAVEFYNTTGERRSLEAFVIHMHLAWLYLLHAEFLRDDIDYRYWETRPDGQHRRLAASRSSQTWLVRASRSEASSRRVRARQAHFRPIHLRASPPPVDLRGRGGTRA